MTRKSILGAAKPTKDAYMRQRARVTPKPRVGQGDVKLSREEFDRRLRERFYDPAFRDAEAEVDRIVDVAWQAYDEYRKSPIKRLAGRGFKNPRFELPVEWLETRRQILAASRRQRARKGPSRVLLVCGAARHDQTCPGEMSKTFRLAGIARRQIQRAPGFECDLLDLSLLTAQYGRQILPARPAYRPRCHSVTGPVRVTRITRWARSTTG